MHRLIVLRSKRTGHRPTPRGLCATRLAAFEAAWPRLRSPGCRIEPSGCSMHWWNRARSNSQSAHKPEPPRSDKDPAPSAVGCAPVSVHNDNSSRQAWRLLPSPDSAKRRPEVRAKHDRDSSAAAPANCDGELFPDREGHTTRGASLETLPRAQRGGIDLPALLRPAWRNRTERPR